ncbi:hypothetical protein [Deinococcus hohokamensis]|uniref:Uncharacterized protein n=1 Tax=Deinococcus hohokamensis TaxID=309883 RepID=A0ABV9I4X3_9DEIO
MARTSTLAGLTEAQASVLRALQAGAELKRHDRPERGSFYTLAGRRLSMPLLKALESQKLVQSEGAAGRTTASYSLTAAGKAALQAWDIDRSAGEGGED